MFVNDGTCLCVRGIPPSCREGDLAALFCPHGRVQRVRIPLDPVSRINRGYAFVTLGSSSEAQASIAALSGVEFSGGRLAIEVSRRSAPHGKTPGVYMGGSIAPLQREGSVTADSQERGRPRLAAPQRARSGGCGRAPPRSAAGPLPPPASGLPMRAGDEEPTSSSKQMMGPPSPRSSPAAEPAEAAEPLSEPAAAAPAARGSSRGRAEALIELVEPATEPGGEPLIEEEPPRCADAPKDAEMLRPDSPRSRISRLEEANIRALAKQTVDSLLIQFQQQGFSDPRSAAHSCLQASLEALGVAPDCGAGGLPAKPGAEPLKKPHTTLEPHSQGPQVLLAPDEFKNPSSFLRVYGDPMAAAAPRRGGCPPEWHQDGNWRCEGCSNVNFPRRQRCHKCQAQRGPSGDSVVLQYCNRVYEMLLKARARDSRH